MAKKEEKKRYRKGGPARLDMRKGGRVGFQIGGSGEGTGGGPEGVLAAAALKCMGCQMQTRLFFQDSGDKIRAKKLDIKDLTKKYNIEDMVKGVVIFCATGVTDGDFVKGVKDSGDSFIAETLVLHESSKMNKIIKNQVKK